MLSSRSNFESAAKIVGGSADVLKGCALPDGSKPLSSPHCEVSPHESKGEPPPSGVGSSGAQRDETKREGVLTSTRTKHSYMLTKLHDHEHHVTLSHRSIKTVRGTPLTGLLTTSQDPPNSSDLPPIFLEDLEDSPRFLMSPIIVHLPRSASDSGT